MVDSQYGSTKGEQIDNAHTKKMTPKSHVKTNENNYNPNKHNGSFKFNVSNCKHAKLKVGK
jgi:hypothetical protein